MKPATPEAYRLLHEGSIAFAQIEHNGVRVDTDYLDRTITEVTEKIDQAQVAIKQDKVWRGWQKQFGNKSKLGSRPQFARVLMDLGYSIKENEITGNSELDESVLQNIDLPFVRNYLQIEKLKKLKSTYLMGLKREVIDGYVHPSYWLHTTATYRPSCSEPNWQNVPVRNPEISELIRRCYIPEPGWRLIEIDYSQIEVKIAACYNHDPKLIHYVSDPTSDMHRDVAIEVFKLKKDQWNKQTRYVAKNMFVFPQFYGSYYLDCARNIWEAITRMQLTVKDGLAMLEHLEAKGISELGPCLRGERPLTGTFEHHISLVEKKFWGERFPVYAQWKDTWYRKYRRRGYFRTLTGFVIEGFYKRNDVVNYPIQGSAFHCLLLAINIIQKWLNKHKMRTKLIGQIHDCLVASSPPDEQQDYINKCHEVMTLDVPRLWPWIIVPLAVEVEVAPTDASWFEKAKWEKADNGIWRKPA